VSAPPPNLRPLDGIRVVDFTSLVAGPWCTRLMADCGAEVIKVEAVGEGDIMRFAAPMVEGMSRVFAHFNCGKKSISLNLKSPSGLALARRLVEKADIVIENFRPGVMARLGLDYAAVSAVKTDLIYCSISGFGQSGPRAKEAAYAPVVHALSGYDHAFMRAQESAETPPVSGIMTADVVAGVYAFGAIQTALVHRERHGNGTFIDATLMESMMSLIGIQYQEAQSQEPIISRRFPPIRVRDGHVAIPLVSMPNYLALYPVIGRPEWSDEFGTLQTALLNRQKIEAELAVWASDKTVDEVEAAMTTAGLPFARYRTPVQMLDDGHLRQRGSFASLEDADGDFVVLNPPFKMSAVACVANPRVARSGEDTAAVLTETLGLNEMEIAQMRQDGAFGRTPNGDRDAR
jgi:CoA:oxalate CoA-transferase